MYKLVKLQMGRRMMFRITSNNNDYLIHNPDNIKKLDTILFLSCIEVACIQINNYYNLHRSIKLNYYTILPEKFNPIIKEILPNAIAKY